MKISSAFPSKYLKASSLPDGQEVPVGIDIVQMEAMEGSGDEKPVLYFLDKKQGLVLNKTNSTTIADAFGDDTEEWHGRQITLYATTTDYAGRTVGCIRVKVPRQAPAPAPAPVAPIAERDALEDVPF